LSRRRRNKNGILEYAIAAVIRLAAVDDDTGCLAVLPDNAGTVHTSEQAAGSLALLSLAAVIGTPGNTLAAREQGKYL
jgi:hypothetical protein